MEVILIKWIIKNKLFIVIGICFIGWSALCFNQGKAVTKAEWDKAILYQQTAALMNEKLNAKIAFEIGSRYETTKDSINDNYNLLIDSLQQSPTRSSVPKSDTTGKSNEGTYCNKLSRDSKRKLLAVMKEAEINTQQLIALQNWCKK